MGGRGVASKGKVPSMVSSSEHPQLCATWTQADIKTLLNYVEENQPKAAVQPNGHHKTAKNCHDKWESLKHKYYVASAIAGGSGLAYSSEKGANVVTEAGQLVMDELLETCPKAGQFQSKGFKCLECMQQFVLPDKARGTNVHHAAGAGTTTQTSHIFRSTSSSCSICSQSAFAPPVQYPPIISATIPITIPITIPTTSHPNWPPSMHSAMQFGFGHHQPNAPDQISWTEMVKDAMADFNQNSNETISRMLAALGNASKDQKLNDVFVMMYELEKDLSEDNFCHLHMLFEENPNFITGYRDRLRRWWVRMRLQAVGCSVPEYTDL
ncbi:hypothetical protein EDC04DRAFT_2609129 [Pisolithus marmoratus]|nr:hypothetical protein EDC04DRAFT_2609129 [Pisolithus marmoratus]